MRWRCWWSTRRRWDTWRLRWSKCRRLLLLQKSNLFRPSIAGCVGSCDIQRVAAGSKGGDVQAKTPAQVGATEPAWIGSTDVGPRAAIIGCSNLSAIHRYIHGTNGIRAYGVDIFDDPAGDARGAAQHRVRRRYIDYDRRLN